MHLAIVEIEDCGEISAQQLSDLADFFNRWGFVVIEHGEQELDPASQVLALGALLGSTYVTIEPTKAGLSGWRP